MDETAVSRIGKKDDTVAGLGRNRLFFGEERLILRDEWNHFKSDRHFFQQSSFGAAVKRQQSPAGITPLMNPGVLEKN